ncbi:hypothetical protein J4526_04995 [Desulfurococcaceae archaeon MEX13E-LK6-19]|nr:hypothetical protein J4526_04995 [Desulfurococcaceae archaeon MEX13E-LK6-19]
MSECISIIISLCENCSENHIPEHIKLCKNYVFIKAPNDSTALTKLIEDISRKTKTILVITERPRAQSIHEILSKYFETILYVLI